MTSSNGNIFRVTDHLCGEFTGPGEFPHKGQWRGALMFSLICVWINGWVNNPDAGGLRRYRTHYDVSVLFAVTTPRFKIQFFIGITLHRSKFYQWHKNKNNETHTHENKTGNMQWHGTTINRVSCKIWFINTLSDMIIHMQYFLSKVSIWNVNCARATAFIFDTRTGVPVKVSKFLRQKMSRPEGGSNPQPSDSYRML